MARGWKKMTKNIFEKVNNSKLYIHIVNVIQRKSCFYGYYVICQSK